MGVYAWQAVAAAPGGTALALDGDNVWLGTSRGSIHALDAPAPRSLSRKSIEALDAVRGTGLVAYLAGA